MIPSPYLNFYKDPLTLFALNVIFENYFVFYETTHQHQTVNSLSSTYRFPTGSLMLPIYKTNLGKSIIKSICSNTWNLVLKDLSKIDIEKYN